MTTAEIEAFLAICKWNSLSRASEELYINQSAMSSRIKSLEKELGTELLIRNKGIRKVKLTHTGELFYPLAVEYMALINEMKQLAGKQALSLRVSAFSSLGSCFLPEVYAKFAERCEGTALHTQDMEEAAACSSILQGGTDIAFSTYRVNDINIESIPVFEEEMLVLASKDSDLNDKVSVSSLDTNKEIFINWCDEFSEWHSEQFGAESQAKMNMSQMEPLRRFLKIKNAWAVVPFSVAANINADGAFRQIETDSALPKRTVFCLCGKNNKEPLIEQLFECIKEVASNYSGVHLLPGR